MKKKIAHTLNKGKCIFKHLDAECGQRLECDGYMKVGCPLSRIANVKPPALKTTSDWVYVQWHQVYLIYPCHT